MRSLQWVAMLIATCLGRYSGGCYDTWEIQKSWFHSNLVKLLWCNDVKGAPKLAASLNRYNTTTTVLRTCLRFPALSSVATWPLGSFNDSSTLLRHQTLFWPQNSSWSSLEHLMTNAWQGNLNMYKCYYKRSTCTRMDD